MTGIIHEGEHPFQTPDEDRDPIRRFRGRLVAPVTVVTAGVDDEQAGLTVSSLMVSEGDPGKLHLLVGPTTDLYDLVGRSGRFVVHILRADQRDLSELFAGRRPSPGGPFATVDHDASEWGPVLADVPDRAYCSYLTGVEQGYSILVSADIDRVEVEDLQDPLAYFRGRYRTVG